MPTPAEIERALSNVKDQPSLLAMLGETLDWPHLDGTQKLEDLAVGWSADDLRAQDVDRDLLDGQVWQLQLRTDQPWGIFVVQFNKAKVSRTALRKVLRGLVPSRRHASGLPAWKHDNLLFICVTRDYKQFTFAHFRGEKAAQARLAMFGWEQGDRHLRTICEHNLIRLAWPDDHGKDAAAWLAQWAAAFDVEAVTKRFFEHYSRVFEAVEGAVKGIRDADRKRLYVQRLFNRLMFLYFIQRKGWLSYQGNKSYLRALYDAAVARKEDFLNHRLYWAFFYGLNNAFEDDQLHTKPELEALRGVVPFLNGGLFDLEDENDKQDVVRIPNAAFGEILDLFERYNFTVTESTPFDVEVAVDPEMLGKVFEELVTGRHESGSYYTPRPIVAFMCREALKHYLSSSPLSEAERGEPDQAIARFVDAGDPSGLRDPEAVLDALRGVKVCDPACGSGAYLLGMMHELVRLREALFKAQIGDQRTQYERKLEIIQNNLYGVDIDPFAVNIAKLRLWLSLAVDYAGPTPPPLPNLDFKIECGDSLTGPDPQKVEDMFRGLLVEKADELAELKGEFLKAHTKAKTKLREKIQKAEADLRQTLHEQTADGAIDWRVAFAEVFQSGGFDVVLGNPPYVLLQNSSLSEEAKDYLTANYKTAKYKVDTYHLFIERGLSLLREGSVIAYITPNTFLKNTHANVLRQLLITRTSILNVVLFYVRVFDTPSVDNLVFLAKQTSTEYGRTTNSIRVHEIRTKELDRELGQFRLIRQGDVLPPDYTFAFDTSDAESALLRKIERGSTLLGEICGTYFGIQTVDREEHVSDRPRTKSFLPVIDGTNVRRFRITPHSEYVDFRPAAIKSGGDQNIYAKPRIVVRQIGRYPEGSICPDGLLTLNTIYNIYVRDQSIDLAFVLGVLNSNVLKFYWLKRFYDNKQTFPKIKKRPLESLPIRLGDGKRQRSLSALVTKIMADYHKNSEQPVDESAIDRLVYELYGLDAADRTMIETAIEAAQQ